LTDFGSYVTPTVPMMDEYRTLSDNQTDTVIAPQLHTNLHCGGHMRFQAVIEAAPVIEWIRGQIGATLPPSHSFRPVEWKSTINRGDAHESRIKIPERALGSKQVDFGGITRLASAIAKSSSIEVALQAKPSR